MESLIRVVERLIVHPGFCPVSQHALRKELRGYGGCLRLMDTREADADVRAGILVGDVHALELREQIR